MCVGGGGGGLKGKGLCQNAADVELKTGGVNIPVYQRLLVTITSNACQYIVRLSREQQ